MRAIEFIYNRWNDMVEKFKMINPRFIQKLYMIYPRLTQNDVELCFLIKMNLSFKKIARILRITDQSMRPKKYRLIKKLDLTRENDLVSWVNALAVKER